MWVRKRSRANFRGVKATLLLMCDRNLAGKEPTNYQA